MLNLVFSTLLIVKVWCNSITKS